MGLTNLQEVIFEEGDNVVTFGERSTSRNDTFKNCTRLTSVYFHDKFAFLGNNTFEGCTSLKSVRLPNNTNYTLGEYMFKGCTELKELKLPLATRNNFLVHAFSDSSIDTIKMSRGTLNAIKNTYGNGNLVFSAENNNKKQRVLRKTDITVTEIGISYKKTDDTDGFISHISNPTKITSEDIINSSIKLSEMKEIEIKDEDEIKEIGEETFKDSSLSTIKLSDSVETIGKNAFVIGDFNIVVKSGNDVCVTFDKDLAYLSVGGSSVIIKDTENSSNIFDGTVKSYDKETGKLCIKDIKNVKGNFSDTTSIMIDKDIRGANGDDKWNDGSDSSIYYNSGSVGINTNKPSYTLDVNGNIHYNGGKLINTFSSTVDSNTNNTTNHTFQTEFNNGQYLLNQSSTVTDLVISSGTNNNLSNNQGTDKNKGPMLHPGRTSWSSYIDPNLITQKNIIDPPSSLTNMNNLIPIEYSLNEDSNTNHIGISYETIKDTFPLIMDKDNTPDKRETIRYQELIPYLVNSIKELCNPNNSYGTFGSTLSFFQI